MNFILMGDVHGIWLLMHFEGAQCDLQSHKILENVQFSVLYYYPVLKPSAYSVLIISLLKHLVFRQPESVLNYKL